MQNICHAINTNIDKIVESWIAIVKHDRKVETATNLSSTAIRDHIPHILSAMVSVLSDYTEDSDIKALVNNSLQHGCLRAAQGFEPAEIVREYYLLQGCIVSVLKAELLLSSHADIIQIMHLINGTIYEALSQCFESYTQERVRELAELNQIKSDFLSTISHELRTPITNMKMAIQMMKIASTEEQSTQYLKVLETECNRESELINNLLDLQRLEALSYVLSPENIILQEWLPEIIQSFQLRAQAYQQIFQISFPTRAIAITVDRASLRRILMELLNNACKYTSAGGEIALRINQTGLPQTEKNPTTTFTVANTATIPETELPRIFEKFYRVPNNDPWHQGGTGLGLALVQKLITQMQGTIYVESANGVTSFIIELPNQPNY